MQPAVAETLTVPPTVSAAAGLSARAIRSSALALSVVAHLAVVTAFLSAPATSPKEPELLVRLVFAEPPPPPPPPAAPAPSENVAPVVVKTQPKPAVEKRKPSPRRVARKAVEKPVEVALPVEPAPAPPVEPSAPMAGTGGVAGGVSGGVEGGTLGGVPRGRGDRPVPVGAVARPPLLVKQVKPTYPPAARRRGVEGLVRLEAVLDLEGRIEEPIRVLESIPALDDAAIAALREWRFAPARDHGGDAVRVILEVPIRFVLR